MLLCWREDRPNCIVRCKLSLLRLSNRRTAYLIAVWLNVTGVVAYGSTRKPLYTGVKDNEQPSRNSIHVTDAEDQLIQVGVPKRSVRVT